MSEPFATNAVMIDLWELTQFADTPLPIAVASTGDMTFGLLTMRAGQRLTNMRSASQVMIQCMRGLAYLQINQKLQTLKMGKVALIEGGQPHDYIAKTDSVFLFTCAPALRADEPLGAYLLQNPPIIQRQSPEL